MAREPLALSSNQPNPGRVFLLLLLGPRLPPAALCFTVSVPGTITQPNIPPTEFNMANTEIKGEVTKELEGRIDLMVRSLLDLPRSKLTALFEHGCVTLNKTPCDNPAARVGAGDRVVVTYDPNQGYSAKKRPWSDRTFTIIHEDDQVLVVNKAAGVLTVPTNKEETNTLLERITTYLSIKKKNHEAYLIHRLDRGMSGVMVFGKTPKAAKQLRTSSTTTKPGVWSSRSSTG